jgi:phosphoribosyl-AMP cyclohydrolase
MSTTAIDTLIEQVRFDDKGLVGAIVQDHKTGEVLMFAWMNRESLAKTLSDGKACYWSRSRQKLWLKGESSGHVQTVKSVHLDCDGDALLLAVEQAGGACHTGHRSCFYRVADGERWREDGEQVFDAGEVYSKTRA